MRSPKARRRKTASRRPPGSGTRHRTVPDPLALAVGTRIRQIRKEMDFTFDAFVEETGLGRGYVSELERGLVVPTIHALAKVATALEVTVADLVLGDSAREQLFAATRGLADGDVRAILERATKMRRAPRDESGR